PVWNNAQRVNHQNKLTHPHPKRKFVPTAILTKSRQVPVNAVKQSSPRAATLISTARPVNTAAPKSKVNDALPTTYSYFKAHSPGNAVKSSTCWIWRPTGNVIDHTSKDSGSYMFKRFDYGNPQYTLQDQGIFDSGCSRHMIGNKPFLTDYQEVDGGFVAFTGSLRGGKFQMSSIGELTFFLGLQVMQRDDGIFISQDKYVVDILKKFDFVTMKISSTPIETHKALLKDEEVENVDVHLYRSMIGSLMYLTASRPDIMFAVCACARFQVTPKVSHLHAEMRIFRYLKVLLVYVNTARVNFQVVNTACAQLQLLSDYYCWKDYADRDEIKDLLENKNTYEDKTEENAEFHQIVDFLTTSSIHYALTVSPTIYASYIEQFWNTANSQTVNDVKQIHATVDGKTVNLLMILMKHLNNTKKVFTNMKRKGKDFSGRVTPLFASMLAPPVVGGEADEAVFKERDDKVVRATTTAASLDAVQAVTRIRSERESKHSYDSPLPGVNTPRSDEKRNEQQDLTDFVPPTPHDSPLSGGHTPGSDEDLVINKLQKKVKRLEKALRERTPGMKLFKIGTSRRKGLDKENVSKQWRKSDKIKPMHKDIDFDVLDDAMENVEDGSTAEQITTARDTLNTASINVSVVGPSTSTTGDIFEDEMTTIADTLMAIRSARPRTTSVMIRNVEEEPRRATPVPTVQSQDKAQFEREQRIARERATKQEAKDAALIEQMEGARFLVETITARKIFAAQRAAEIRNRPPTRTQLRNQMITYLKHMGNGKKDDSSSKQAESSKKRPRAEHDEESVKKQKLQDDAEKEELRACLDIVQGDDIAIDVESLATKYPIVDWKTHILTKNMILVKERYDTTSPEGYDLLLWGDLKTLFEPCEEDEV
ncbi:putative ribonuclease H-like domain-containing protein, partial [Tanacetum coccineum]